VGVVVVEVVVVVVAQEVFLHKSGSTYVGATYVGVHLYSVESTFIATVTVDIFETDRKCLVARAESFSSYQPASSPLHVQLCVIWSLNLTKISFKI
jgi:hypothetical protein